MYGDYGSTAAAAGVTAIVGAFLGFFILFFVVILAVAIIGIIGKWKVLEKSGQPGWAAIIPFYSDYCLCKAVGVWPWYVLVVYGGIILSNLIAQIPIIGLTGSLLSVAVSALSIYYAVILCFSITKAFGKNEAFAIGLLFLRPIFLFILGTKNNQFVGINPMNDPLYDMIFNNSNRSNNNVNTVNNMNSINMNTNTNTDNNMNSMNNSMPSNNNQSSFCTGCGAQLEENTRFCTNCGKEI